MIGLTCVAERGCGGKKMENTHVITIDIGGDRTEFIKSSDAKGVDTMLSLRNNRFITGYTPLINVMVSVDGVDLNRTRMVIQKIKNNLQNIPDGYFRVGTLRVCEAKPGVLATTEKRYKQENYRSSDSYLRSHGWGAYEVALEKQAGFLQDLNDELPMPDRHVDRFMNYAAIICDMLKIYVDRVVIPRENGYEPLVFRFDAPVENPSNDGWVKKLQTIRNESIEYYRRLEEVRIAHDAYYVEKIKENDRIYKETIKMIEQRRKEAEETHSKLIESIHNTLSISQEPIRQEYRERWLNRVVQDEIQEEKMAQRAEKTIGPACVLI